MEALFITTNTGSVELRNVPCTVWIDCLTEAILESSADVVAVHIQESNEQATKKLLKELTLGTKMCRNGELPCSRENQRIFTFLSSADRSDEFTGLGAIYVFRSNEAELEIWNFKDNQFFPVPPNKRFQAAESYSTTVTSNTSFDEGYLKYCVDGRQFPAALFPSGTPSRKGFMRTRWRINGLTLELVNIHLFNDSCNLQSLKEHPSVFARFRAAGLKWTLETIQADQCEDQHLVVFGDFNFRLNLPLYVERLLSAHSTSSSSTVHLVEDNAKSTIDRADTTFSSGDIVISERQFHVSHDDRLTWSNFEMFLPLDEEMLIFSDQLEELPIKFPPSYPFRDGDGLTHEYNTTRCPAWCDRILFSRRTFSCLLPPDHCPILYDLLGKDVALGDHKPVYAYCRLTSN